jgi:primosomal protein N' (replication factor Y) (superfamily II helicase)
MNAPKQILRIALPVPLRKLFDYLPINTAIPMQPGMRVLVPFGRQRLVGILIEVSDHTLLSEDKLKAIITLLDEAPIFSTTTFALCLWASRYYHHPVGEVFSAAMPALLRQGKSPRMGVIEKSTLHAAPHLTLNVEQQQALDKITAAQGFQTFLLEGVTGSGKTEVYLQSIDKIIHAQQQALVLVPEISLTPQTVSRFTTRFQVPIAVLHSNVGDKDRLQAWTMAATGTARIVIGTRSAVFTPMPQLKLIIIDEEHDLSFKQQEGFRYSARDLALKRAQLEQCAIVLGSATPSFETLQNTKLGRFQHLIMQNRAGHAQLPTFDLIDLRKQKLQQGLSPLLLKKMQYHLEQNHQVLIFLNRRGYSPTLLCHDCGLAAECTHCDARLTYHKIKNILHCHHCEQQMRVPTQCGSCGSTDLMPLGQGTQRIEAFLASHFPQFKTVRIDRDSTRGKNKLHDLLDEVQTGHYQILVGTQMLAKGHHFPRVTLVVILEADQGLLSADFRAAERLGQLIMQVAGRAGRASLPGTVAIQTHHPQHPLLTQLINEGYHAFAQQALQEREMAGLPPHSHMALMRAESSVEADSITFLQRARELITPHAQVQILGPIPAPMQRKQGRYRAHLLLQTKSRNALQQLMTLWLEKLEGYSLKGVRWSLDIDPQSLS